MPTTLLLDGFLFTGFLQYTSIAERLGNLQQVTYDNLIPIESVVEEAMNLLDTAITAAVASGHVTVLCISEGSQVAAKWLREKGPTSTVSPSDLDFILMGFPENKFTGATIVAPTLFTGVYPGTLGTPAGIGVPASTPYDVTVFSRQYDGWADYPNLPNPNLFAVSNAIAGMGSIHDDYFSVDVTDPENSSHTEGNVTYTWSPTRLLDEDLRGQIESSYDRPVTMTNAPPIVSTATPPVIPPAANPVTALDQVNQQFLQGDLMSRAIAAEQIAQYKSQYNKDFITTIYDKFWIPTGEFGDDMLELTGTDPRNKLPSATLRVSGGSEKILQLMECVNEMVGITVETGGMMLPYYVKTFDYEFKDGEWVGTANLLGIWDILNYMQIWPNNFQPLEVQIPSYAIFIWALCGVVESMVGETAFRIQSGINEFVNNLGSVDLDWRTWFASILDGPGNIVDMLKTPVYVVYHNPLLDSSPFVARTVRMESVGTVIADITKAYGVDCRLDLWLPGMEQPDPYANLTKPTYVFTATDRSQIEGPTKTVLDSVIRTVVDASGSFFGSIPGIISTVPGMDSVFQAPVLGVDYVAPWAVLIAPEPPQKGSVVDCKLSFHTMSGHTHILGGQSPKWLNDLMNATFSWLIDSLSILIGVTGIPSNLLEGFLNNAFLAFQSVQDFDRRTKAGPYHPGVETFTAIQSGTYNIETVFAFLNKLWDTRGYVSAMASFRNGEVYTLGKDVFRGGLMSVLYMNRTKLFTDYIEMVMFHITPTTRDVLVQIGDGKAEESPLAKHQRFLTGIFESINVITLAPQGGS